MIEELQEQPQLQMAAMIGRYFRIDPVIPLDSDYFHWAVRVAALQYVVAEEKKASDRAGRANKFAADSRISRMV